MFGDELGNLGGREVVLGDKLVHAEGDGNPAVQQLGFFGQRLDLNLQLGKLEGLQLRERFISKLLSELLVEGLPQHNLRGHFDVFEGGQVGGQQVVFAVGDVRELHSQLPPDLILPQGRLALDGNELILQNYAVLEQRAGLHQDLLFWLLPQVGVILELVKLVRSVPMLSADPALSLGSADLLDRPQYRTVLALRLGVITFRRLDLHGSPAIFNSVRY